MAKNQVSVEVKLEAVRRVLEDQCPVAVIAEELGLHRDTIYRWVNVYKSKGKQGLISPRSLSPSSHSSQSENLKRIKELEKQLKEKEMENEILKKFQAFLKKNE